MPLPFTPRQFVQLKPVQAEAMFKTGLEIHYRHVTWVPANYVKLERWPIREKRGVAQGFTFWQRVDT